MVAITQFNAQGRTPPVTVILAGELFSKLIVDIFIAQFFPSSIFSCFYFPNIGMLTTFIFLRLENFTNSDRTPPYIDTCLQLFSKFGKFGKKALR